VDVGLGDGKPNTLFTKMLGSKGLGIKSSCAVDKGCGGCGCGCCCCRCDDTKTRELSVVRRELKLNPVFSSETLCRKRISETDMGMLSVGDSRPSNAGWTWRCSMVCVNPEVPRERRSELILYTEGGRLTCKSGIGNVLGSGSEGIFCEPFDEPFKDDLDFTLGTVVLLHLDFPSIGG